MVKAKSKAVFLDRDGVLNEVVLRGKEVASPRSYDEFRLFDGLTPSLQELKDLGFRLFVVTNQPDISRGRMPQSELDKMTHRILTMHPVERVLVCPHDSSDGCNCRKPKPGMLIQIANEENVDLKASFIIGDSVKDIGAGRGAGCKTILLRRDYNQDVEADFVVESVAQAVNLIRKGDTSGDAD